MMNNTTENLKCKGITSRTPMDQATDDKAPAQPTKTNSFKVGTIIESDAQPNGVQLKREALQLTMNRLKLSM